MDKDVCGTREGWMRVAYVDMTQPNQECPTGFTTINTPKRLCGRTARSGCTPTTFSTNDFPYTQVCGKVIAYQHKTPDGPCPYKERYIASSNTLEGPYIDGVSLTHGSPRQHIWSFIAAHGESSYSCAQCPCFNTTGAKTLIPFIGNDYFCDTGANTSAKLNVFYDDDPLWDGQGCGPNNNCCTFNSPPWFSTQLNDTTTDELELRICGNERIGNEDIPIEHIELYIQ